ncbi:DUF4157 domain-containing protein [Nostoc sp. TCL240-02]|nr:DUF4157 domain-containing protein [Nostoc sp. TCL240-02]
MPESQERLTLLQAKMDGLLNSRLEHATRFGHNFANIPLRRPDTPIQAKLTIGEPGDKYEQEADETARQVVQRIHQPQSEKIQRESLPEEENELQMKLSSNIQREELPEEEDELQMKSMVQRVSDGGMAATLDLETGIQQARGSGQPLAKSVREPMEQAFSADFSGVKVHTDGQSDQLNQSIQARAFTTGQDVFFRQGEYNPGSRGGQELIAHELTHVVQQTQLTDMRKASTQDFPLQKMQEVHGRIPVIQRALDGVEVKVGDHIKDNEGDQYKITSLAGEEVVAVGIGKNNKEVKVEFTIGGWDDAYTKIATVGGSEEKRSSEDVGNAVDKISENKQEQKYEDSDVRENEELKEASKEEKTEINDRESQLFPKMAVFNYDLPNGLGTLEWVDEKQYQTKNGWMSKNINFTLNDSIQKLGGQAEISAHAIIAIKDDGAGVIRINPHFTMRDTKRQNARQEAEEKRAKSQKGHQKANKSRQEREEEAKDALWSKQIGLKSTRADKGGEESKLITLELSKLPFKEKWIKGIADAAITAAKSLKLEGVNYEIGNARSKFEFKD